MDSHCYSKTLKQLQLIYFAIYYLKMWHDFTWSAGWFQGRMLASILYNPELYLLNFM
jgi:hypothetical protein